MSYYEPLTQNKRSDSFNEGKMHGSLKEAEMSLATFKIVAFD